MELVFVIVLVGGLLLLTLPLTSRRPHRPARSSASQRRR
jgi:type II secretory pathway pseudopilin PulG